MDFIKELEDGGYEIRFDEYQHRSGREPGPKTRRTLTAEKVIVSAGTTGTSEIMLRSKEKGGLPGLSDKVGYGFSTNGDYIAFMENTRERVRLTRGPVTTSFAHFNTDDPEEDPGQENPIYKDIEKSLKGLEPPLKADDVDDEKASSATRS